MNNYKVLYSPAAKEDLFSIYSYIAVNLMEPQAAAKQTNRIRDAIRELETFPNRYNIVDLEPWTIIKLRKFPVDNYIVFYYVDDNNYEVRIVRIVYSGRDLRNILN